MPNPKKPVTKATQKFLDISEIREGVVILRDGSMRIVFLTSSVNFELKSDTEKNSLIYGFQGFLNSLEFPVQILVQSRMLDINDYLNRLSDRAEAEVSELIRLQILDYVDFVKRLITVANIMDRKFYVVVPHYPGKIQKPPLLGGLFGAPAGEVKFTPKEFEEHKDKLLQRAERVAQSLQAMGLRAIQLNTQELIELFYNLYNPGIATRQKIASIPQLTAEVVEELEEMEI